MYARLKHALSTLALDAVRAPGRQALRAEVAWLVAYCNRAARLPARHSFGIPIALVARGARRHAADRAAPRRLARRGLLDLDADALWLPAGFHTSFPYMHRQVHRLARVLGHLDGVALPRGHAGMVRRAAALFNGGLFFECHEYLEGPWSKAPGHDKGFYRGIIHVAAAFYHYEKDNLHGARVKITSGIETLRGLPPLSHGVRLDRWLKRLAAWKTRVDAGIPGGALKISEIPKMQEADERGVQ
jgi:predicted metal-dependent hydrolase